MPEGDTIHKTARRFRRTLVGHPVRRVYVQGHGGVEELAGSTVAGVDVSGKHMLIHFDRGWSLRVHLGMTGKWSPPRPDLEDALHGQGAVDDAGLAAVDEASPSADTAVILETAQQSYVCRKAYHTELLRTRHIASHPRLRALGPDLLADTPDLDAVLGRARLPAHAGREIGDLVIDQRVASGIGNVYKSEVLFIARVHPRASVSAVSDEVLRHMFEEVARLMRRNLLTRRRETVPLQRRPYPGSPRLWVYGRGGQPCLECEASIVRIVQGSLARSTYFCPKCQVQGAPTFD